MALGPYYSLHQYNEETRPNSSIYPLVIYACLWARTGNNAGDREMKVSAYRRAHICLGETRSQTLSEVRDQEESCLDMWEYKGGRMQWAE